MKNFIKTSIALVMIVIIVVSFFNLYNRLPHHSTDIDNLIDVNSEFASIPIESCDFYQKSDVLFMGGVLEFYSCGKINVSKEYYESLLKTYSFRECSGIQDYQGMNTKKLFGEFKDFITNKTYLISEEFQGMFYSFVCLSTTEPSIYYYFYTY